ncbi:MAG TPA: sulfatase [Roseiflexaceae bacterium]|nr:sulfatase [Roseiflexaceae bacterium]
MSDTPRPNILWITTHDISPDLGCYAGVWPGAGYAHTPHLDQLAAEGARYDQAFAVAPVCAPSRSAIITGMYPTAIGTMHMRSRAVPPPEVRCFPEELRAAGYYCTNNAFSDFQFQTPVTVWDAHGPQAHWRNRPDPTQPFFAVFHGMVTHESQIYADEEQYQRNTRRLTPTQRHDPAAAPLPPYYPDTPVFRQAWARYSDNVTAMDYWAGDLLRQLADDGLADTTLVVFWSDHGLGMPRAKRWPYDSGLRVPLLVRWPGRIAPGTVRAEPVTLLDLAATTLAAAGLPVPAHMHARPLFDAQGRPSSPRPYIFGHRDRMDEQEDTIRTVRDGRFRYIRNYHPDRPAMQHLEYADCLPTWRELRRLHFEEATLRGRGETPGLLTPAQRRVLASSRPEEELYDVRADPYEIEDLAGDPRYAADLTRLRDALAEWQQTYGDLGLIPEAELIERWRPGGVAPATAPPAVEIVDGRIVATCATEGASIGWTADPPRPHEAPGLLSQITGDPDTGGRAWHLYRAPFPAPPGITLWFRAQRLGYQASADVAVAVEP